MDLWRLIPRVALLCWMGFLMSGCGGEDAGQERMDVEGGYSFHHERVQVGLGNGSHLFDIHLLVAESNEYDEGEIFYLLHGFCHNSNFYKPAIRNIFNRFGDRVFRIYAVDLPGHGESELPKDYKRLGELSLDDYVQVNLQVLEEINRAYGHVDFLAGHSMGGLLIQMIQHALLIQGLTLTNEFETDYVLLLASGLPMQIPSSFSEVVAFLLNSVRVAFSTLSSLKVNPLSGLHVDFSNEDFLEMFFKNKDGEMVAGAPKTQEELEELKSFDSLRALIELGLLRPDVQRGAFAGCRVATVAYEQDILLAIDWQSELHTYLLGGDARESLPREGFFPVLGAEAIHDGPYSMPESLMSPIGYLLER